jgi:cytochrome b pre-mRNA-processing protein 3
MRQSQQQVATMIFRLFRRDPQAATIAALYGAIVAQARNPSFYLGFGVPDTAEGRFDMILLHLALFCRRLGGDPVTAGSLGQDVFDMFCRDMDHNLREMGVGDLSVPKKMQKMAEAFYGRLETYDRALAAAGEDDLAGALARNVLGEATPSGSARRLAAYARAAARRLDETPVADLTGETQRFPDPDTIPALAGGAAP